MADSLDVSNSRVRVEGLSRTVRNLSRAGVDAEDQKDLMHSIGQLIVNAATPPVLSGTLAGTIRAGRGKSKAVIRAGGARAPYAGVIEYGNRARNKPEESFLNSALAREQSAVFTTLDEGINALLRKNDLI